MQRNGQALIVVLLILGVVTTVALSIASRSVSEVAVSTTQQESAQALAAAEAGVEATLGGIAPPSIAGSTIKVDSTPAPASRSLLVADALAAGQVATINLVDYGGNNVQVLWDDANAGLEAAYYYTQGGTTKVSRDYKTGGSMTINVNVGTKQYLRLRLWGNTTAQQLTVRGLGADLPSQGMEYTATGQTGDSVRRIKVYDQKPDVPEVWESAVFSGGDLVK